MTSLFLGWLSGRWKASLGRGRDQSIMESGGGGGFWMLAAIGQGKGSENVGSDPVGRSLREAARSGSFLGWADGVALIIREAIAGGGVADLGLLVQAVAAAPEHKETPHSSRKVPAPGMGGETRVWFLTPLLPAPLSFPRITNCLQT